MSEEKIIQIVLEAYVASHTTTDKYKDPKYQKSTENLFTCWWVNLRSYTLASLSLTCFVAPPPFPLRTALISIIVPMLSYATTFVTQINAPLASDLFVRAIAFHGRWVLWSDKYLQILLFPLKHRLHTHPPAQSLPLPSSLLPTPSHPLSLSTIR